MGKKKKKYDDLPQLYQNVQAMMPDISAVDNPRIWPGCNIPDDFILETESSGVFLGLEAENNGKGYYVGKAAENDGNILTLGISGSGKSSVLVKSTLETWKNVFVTIDEKRELLEHYRLLLQNHFVRRQYLVFDPSNGGSHYDVYAQLKQGDPHFVQYVREIAYALIPKPPDVRDPYWINLARDILSGAIVYYRELGLGFIETMLMVQDTSTAALCDEIMREGSRIARMFVSEAASLEPRQQASIGTEIKEYTMVFATDPDIQSALSVREEDDDGFGSFSWEDIVSDADAPNVFLCIGQDMLEQWSGVLRLMVTQLIRQLERRPEKYSPQGNDCKPLLLLLDEFPLLGKMEVVKNAMTTLRSKNVTLYIVIQSIAQLDNIYDANVRKILMDNCRATRS